MEAADSGRYRPRKSRRRCICLSATAATVIGLLLLFLILGLTVFKPKDPIINVDSVALAGLDFSIDITNLRVHVNVTLNITVTVKNPNRVGFQHDTSTAFLRFRGHDVGQALVPSGKIGARHSSNMNITLTLFADRVASDPDFYNDAISGKLPFQTYIRLPGKARLIFNIHVVAYATCDLVIDVFTQAVASQTCHYKTKL
ncbi:uncharacterized protein [Primulina huaijiensis]|uniref:uncharacterized protein n=1 Tax=Primulina huaijiensis TaxID=1492673 RepID=UPI003CC778BD